MSALVSSSRCSHGCYEFRKGYEAGRQTEDAMSNEFVKLELERVLQADAAEIVAAREKAQLIHRTRDIDAA